MYLAGQVLGYGAIVVSFFLYQQKSRSNLLIFKAISDVLWISHYFLLGAYTGVAVTAVALCRSLVFFRTDPRSKVGRFGLVCFLCLSVICTVLTWQSAFSIFAMLGSLIAIVSFWIGEPKLSRILAFPVSVCMLIYGVSNGSVPVLINELIVQTSSVIGILRHDRRK